jgi:hypothetical protein
VLTDKRGTWEIGIRILDIKCLTGVVDEGRFLEQFFGGPANVPVFVVEYGEFCATGSYARLLSVTDAWDRVCTSDADETELELSEDQLRFFAKC